MTWREAEEAANAGERVRCVLWAKGSYISQDGNGQLMRRVFREGPTWNGTARKSAGRLYNPSFEAIKAEWEFYK